MDDNAKKDMEPIPMLLWCPHCGERHVDEGEFATKPHHTHACQGCGHVWRPAKVATVGVRFLPDFENEPLSIEEAWTRMIEADHGIGRTLHHAIARELGVEVGRMVVRTEVVMGGNPIAIVRASLDGKLLDATDAPMVRALFQNFRANVHFKQEDMP